MKAFYEVENLSTKLTGYVGGNYEVVDSLPMSDAIYSSFAVNDGDDWDVEKFNASHVVPALYGMGQCIKSMSPVLIAAPPRSTNTLSPRREHLFLDGGIPVLYTVEYIGGRFGRHEFTLSVLVKSKMKRNQEIKNRIAKLVKTRASRCEQIRSIDAEVSTIQDSCSHVYRDFVCTICKKVAAPGVIRPKVCNNCHTIIPEDHQYCLNCGWKSTWRC